MPVAFSCPCTICSLETSPIFWAANPATSKRSVMSCRANVLGRKSTDFELYCHFNPISWAVNPVTSNLSVILVQCPGLQIQWHWVVLSCLVGPTFWAANPVTSSYIVMSFRFNVLGRQSSNFEFYWLSCHVRAMSWAATPVTSLALSYQIWKTFSWHDLRS